MNRNLEPLFSIILPTYNRVKGLQNALKSVFTQENQNWELIIVNDGKMDVTRYLINDKRIVCIKNKTNLGQPASRNKGLHYASGQFIAYLDDDDEWLPNHLTLSEQILQSYDFIYSGAFCRKEGRLIPWYNEEFSFRKLAERNFIPTSVVIHKKNLMEKTGVWNEKLKCLLDWEMWCRMLLKTNSIYHRKDITVIYGWSQDSVTLRSAKSKIRKRTKYYIQMRYYIPLVLKQLFFRRGCKNKVK
jgi:glycosyltransferase involved in cell wall biosynthesis